jgi:hypothetical protein
MTEWIYRLHIAVPIAQKAAANTAVRAITGKDVDLATFNIVRLSPDGQEPASWVAASTLAKPSMRASYEAIKDAAPGTRFVLYDAATMKLLKSNVAAIQAHVGEIWSWEQTLAAVGLRVIRPVEV